MRVTQQVRFEQRWKRDYIKDSPFFLSFRYRYKLSFYYELDGHIYQKHGVFLSAYNEILLQTGEKITYNTLEDNRLFVGLGFDWSEELQFQAGYMNTYRFDKAPNKREIRHIIRVSAYHKLNFYNDKKKAKISQD